MQRVILLGASNLTLAFPAVFENLCAHWQGEVEVFAAHGHGRSYGMTSRVLFRSLPGVTVSRLWSDFAGRDDGPQRTLALLTDVGNDLLYGADVAMISGWVETCLSRLASRDAETVLTLLPLESVLRMSALRYHATKQLFFPGSGVSWGAMQQRARELNARLVELGNQYGAAVVEPRREWYGFDPIHIRRGRRRAVWQEILRNWRSLGETFEMRRTSRMRAVELWRMRPAERWLFGRTQTREQPVIRHEAGTTLWLY